MKRLIIRRSSNEFLAWEEKWSKEISKAQHFPEMDTAIKVLASLNLPDAAIYYAFDDDAASRFDFTLDPFSKPRPHLPEPDH